MVDRSRPKIAREIAAAVEKPLLQHAICEMIWSSPWSPPRSCARLVRELSPQLSSCLPITLRVQDGARLLLCGRDARPHSAMWGRQAKQGQARVFGAHLATINGLPGGRNSS